MASIVNNVTGNQAIQMGNEEFVRTMAFGYNWQKIRIQFRWQVNTAVKLPSSARLLVGVCQGTADTYSSSNCISFFGTGPDASLGIGWSISGDGTYQNTGSGYSGGKVVKKIGSTITTNFLGEISYCKTVAGANPRLFAVEIVRVTNGTYNAAWWSVINGTQLYATINDYDYYRCLEDDDGTTYSTGYYSRYGTATLVSGLSDFMDTISINWNVATAPIEITQLSVMRFY